MGISFKDTKDRTWTVVLNVHTVKQIRDELKVDLLSPTPETMLTLASDTILLVGALSIALSEDMEKQKVEPEGFARSLGGDVLDDATDCLIEAIVNFSRRHQRPALRKALERVRAAEEKIGKAAEKTLDDPRMEKMIDREIAESIAEIESEIYGPSSTNSQASSESIPDP